MGSKAPTYCDLEIYRTDLRNRNGKGLARGQHARRHILVYKSTQLRAMRTLLFLSQSNQRCLFYSCHAALFSSRREMNTTLELPPKLVTV